MAVLVLTGEKACTSVRFYLLQLLDMLVSLAPERHENLKVEFIRGMDE